MKKKKWLNSKIVFTIAMVFVGCCFILTSLWSVEKIDFHSAKAKVQDENDNLTRDEGFTSLPQGTAVTASLPPVADFIASYICITRDDNITFTDQSINNPTSWSWTFEGGTPATSTAQNPTVTYNTVGTFNVTLVAANAQGSDTETKLDYIYVAEKPYCTSSGSSQSYEYIASVAVADLNNPSGDSPYTDFTIQLAHLEQGDTVNVSLTPGFPGSSYTEYWRIWIDYNGDHDFEDAGEQVFSGSGSSVVSGSFTVPTSTITGNTRMRVSMSYSTYPPICGSFTYGEIEDYTANISSAILPVRYTLTTNTVGQGNLTLEPPDGTYLDGTVVTLTAVPYSGWQFDNWSGDLTGSTNPDTITMNADKTVTANFSVCTPTTGIVGITNVYGSTSTTANRRAMPFTMPENGTINSVTMYHTGASGSMILGVYDGASLPDNRLGVTATTAVSGSTGWQTINLTSPTFVSGGTTVWLAWVYESNPGIRYQTGSPGRAQSPSTWSGGMPDPFGSSIQSNYIYSIYATYTPSAPSQYTLTTNVVGQGSITLYPPGGIYDEGRFVILTAVPDADWQFEGWSGDLSGTQNPTTITMNADKNVTAVFSVNYWGYAEVVDEETYSEWEQEKFVPSLDETAEVPPNETVIKLELIVPDDNNIWYHLELGINSEGEIALVKMEQVSGSEVASVVGISHTHLSDWWPVCCLSQLYICNVVQNILPWLNLNCVECFYDCLCIRVNKPCHACDPQGLTWLLCRLFQIGSCD